MDGGGSNVRVRRHTGALDIQSRSPSRTCIHVLSRASPTITHTGVGRPIRRNLGIARNPTLTQGADGMNLPQRPSTSPISSPAVAQTVIHTSWLMSRLNSICTRLYLETTIVRRCVSRASNLRPVPNKHKSKGNKNTRFACSAWASWNVRMQGYIQVTVTLA